MRCRLKGWGKGRSKLPITRKDYRKSGRGLRALQNAIARSGAVLNPQGFDHSASPDRQYGQRRKPRRGGLFIDAEPSPFFFFLFFGGAYIEQTYCVQPGSDGVSGYDLVLTAPPNIQKTK